MKKIVLSVLLIGIVVTTSVGAYLAVSESGQRASAAIPPASSIVSRHYSDPGTVALNAVVDASGLKQKIDGALRANAGAISEQLSISESQVNAAIDMLDIESWEVANLPEGTTESSSYTVACDGADIDVTTYVDPSYVTVAMHGQEITFAVPDNAQSSLSLLSLLA